MTVLFPTDFQTLNSHKQDEKHDLKKTKKQNVVRLFFFFFPPPFLSSEPVVLLQVRLAECCFTSTETLGLLGTGAQDGRLDFHTAPELCDSFGSLLAHLYPLSHIQDA